MSATKTCSLKTSEYLDIIYKKKSTHTWIEETRISKKVVIIRSTREVSQNIIIHIVSYKAIKKSLVVYTQ